MESYGNEIRVQQGEDWNLDKKLLSSQLQNIPYIISSQRKNPYFVITVASTKYEKNLRYVKSWWCSIEDSEIPTFYSTIPVFYDITLNDNEVPDYSDLSVGDFVQTNVDAETTGVFYTYNNDASNPQWTKKILPDQYDSGSTYYKLEPALHYYIDSGERHYFYYDYSVDSNKFERVDGYECHVRMNFASKDTAEWGSQNYLYQITLVSGQTMRERLQEIYEQYTPEQWPTITEDMDDEEVQATIEAQYKYVKANYPNELQPDIDIDSPLGYIDTPEVILQPTKLEVYNNLRKLI